MTALASLIARLEAGESGREEPEIVLNSFGRPYVLINGKWEGPFRNGVLARLAHAAALKARSAP